MSSADTNKCLSGTQFTQGFERGKLYEADDSIGQVKTGVRVAFTSSGRLIGAVCGALCRRSESSATILCNASEKASSVAFDSVSVGSNIMACGTSSGK